MSSPLLVRQRFAIRRCTAGMRRGLGRTDPAAEDQPSARASTENSRLRYLDVVVKTTIQKGGASEIALHARSVELTQLM